jgi:hypothetical protein
MGEVFSVIPNGTTILLFVGIIVLVAIIAWRSILINKMKPSKILFSKYALLPIILVVILGASYMTNVTVDENSISVNSPFSFSFKVIEKNDVERIFVVDWNSNESYRPSRRDLGMGFGDYKFGSFTLNNGQSALLLSTDSNNLYIETIDGEIILLSPLDFDNFVSLVDDVFLPIENIDA